MLNVDSVGAECLDLVDIFACGERISRFGISLLGESVLIVIDVNIRSGIEYEVVV